MIVLNSKQVKKMERLEAEILRYITKLHHCSNLIKPLLDEANQNRARLRNLVNAYKAQVTEAELDDLLFAIIRDDALSREDMQIVFDLNDNLFQLAINRMIERDLYDR